MDIPKAVSVGYPCIPRPHCTSCCKVPRTTRKDQQVWQGSQPSFLKTGDALFDSFQPTKPLAIEQMDTFPELSRFAIRDMGKTVAAGVCLKIEKK